MFFNIIPLVKTLEGRISDLQTTSLGWEFNSPAKASYGGKASKSKTNDGNTSVRTPAKLNPGNRGPARLCSPQTMGTLRSPWVRRFDNNEMASMDFDIESEF